MTSRRAPDATSFASLLAQRLTRRQVIEGGAALAVAGAALWQSPVAAAVAPGTLAFKMIKGSAVDDIVLPPGYTYDKVVRWGDSLSPSIPDLDTSTLVKGGLFAPGAAERQRGQFGQNCDAIRFFPLDERGDRGVLCVNNEYTDDGIMFVGHPGTDGAARGEGRAYVQRHRELVPVAIAATGVSIVEVKRERGGWRMVKDSRFNRRVTADTPIDLGGPARGAALVCTRADPTGSSVFGTFANCAGGETPWGTYLTAEENIQDYFGNLDDLKKKADAKLIDAHSRFRMWRSHSLYGWENVYARFDLTQEPHEPFRFGWIVEIDPRDPAHRPVKRTALGRFAHEGASPVIAGDGRIAVYMGDDDKFEYVYKFVSSGRYDAKNREANRDLLDAGTLHVARFDASGAGQWLPLVHDPKGPLNAAAGFANQAEVLIRARAAAHLLGATPMDRPEDVEANPVTGRIYIACTRNEQRTAASGLGRYAGHEIDTGPNAANPRGANAWGHIIEIRERGDDHTAREFTWEVFLMAGDPKGGRLLTDAKDLVPGKVGPNDTYFAGFANAAELSPIGSPDNIGFDAAGNLWLVTDGPQPGKTNDGCYVCPTSGPDRGRLRQFMSGPNGAEICGCQFTPDGETLFLSIQHPGESGTVEAPASHWPDGPGTQPRATVIAVRREGGGAIGT